MNRSIFRVKFIAGIALLLANPGAGFAGSPISAAIAPPAYIDLHAGHDTDQSSALLYEVIREELIHAGLALQSVSEQPLDSAELVDRAARQGYRLALSVYIVREAGRIGFGLNAYDTEIGYVVTGRSASGASEFALSRSIARELSSLADDLAAYLEADRRERETAVHSIEFATGHADVTITLADGRNLRAEDGRSVTVTDLSYRMGQTISFTARRDGHYPRTLSYPLSQNHVYIAIPPLAPRTRFAAGIRLLPVHIAGAGTAFRWYPVADEFFFEVAAARFTVDADTRFAGDLNAALGQSAAGSDVSFRLTDVTISLGTYLFVPRDRLLRPGLQIGAGAMRAENDRFDLMLPYISPLNVFLSIGRNRFRGRVVSTMRYLVGSDRLDRYWLIYDELIPYAWIEAGYTW